MEDFQFKRHGYILAKCRINLYGFALEAVCLRSTPPLALAAQLKGFLFECWSSLFQSQAARHNFAMHYDYASNATSSLFFCIGRL